MHSKCKGMQLSFMVFFNSSMRLKNEEEEEEEEVLCINKTISNSEALVYECTYKYPRSK